MPVQSEIVRRAPARPDLLLNGDMRRHRRLPLVLAGRFMRADRSEFPCTLRDVSVGGASVTTDASVDVDERIVAYFEHLGGLEGSVVREFNGGFAFQFKVSDHKREKLAAQIMWLANREAFPEALGRLHMRTSTAGRKTTLKFHDGVIVDVDLLDLSVSGASIGTTARPPVGAEVWVGRFPAVVRRHHDKGVGVQFLTVQSDEALRAAFP